MTDINAIEKALYSYLPSDAVYEKKLTESMKYSLEAGGKRIRPTLTLAFASLLGADEEVAMPFACAVEMIHTYSLIHDDLPCMDDDDMRRGKPSNHKVFGEDIALLAGDALQSLAFEIMTLDSTAEKAGYETCCKCVNILSRYCGAVGMVGGQVIDLAFENKKASLEIISEMDRKKTGGLIKAACLMGCAVGNASSEEFLAAEKYAENIGLAFQIVDDILDVTSTEQELGKPIGSDADNNKSNYVTELGIEECQRLADKLTCEALEALNVFSGDTSFLASLAQKLARRKN
ncbi:MAG: polyprenyl synthetase family protein [Ruminococcus sp.]|nr:polyprenyl synthetase family protein [Ruminococcus sp.]